jgi:hypothetical protein
MKSIGGFFELELPRKKEYHNKAIKLNTGRNAFEYILRAKKYKKVYLPYYTCDAMLEPISKLRVQYEFYTIDLTLRPVFDFSRLKETEAFVYNNYFGIGDRLVVEVATKCKNLIVDNSQAFFAEPLAGTDSFYSARKFFGVPDGAYVYTDFLLNEKIEKDISYHRVNHLVGRIDINPEFFFQDFKNNENILSNQPIKLMSNLTEKILFSIDYEGVAKKRKNNFEYIHTKLKESNSIEISLSNTSVPLGYPYLIYNGLELKKTLIEQKVYIPTLWPNVIQWASKDSFEAKLSNDMVLIPTDHRYNSSELQYILDLISQYALQ